MNGLRDRLQDINRQTNHTLKEILLPYVYSQIKKDATVLFPTQAKRGREDVWVNRSGISIAIGSRCPWYIIRTYGFAAICKCYTILYKEILAFEYRLSVEGPYDRLGFGYTLEVLVSWR